MEMLTTVADAILCDDLESSFQLTPTKNVRFPFGNLTNKPISLSQASSKYDSSSHKALIQGKICNIKCNEKTPCKKRKSSIIYGDENEAPSPKTPKNIYDFYMNQKEKSPISPMSNLKLLTRIASMEEHRPIPSKKTLFNKNDLKVNMNFRRCYSDNATDRTNLKPSISNFKLKKYPTSSELGKNVADVPMVDKNTTLTNVGEGSRREKSLGLLCERFLEHFPIKVTCLETPRRLIIDDVASTLGTERRRVYDIVNILECLNMTARVQKNMYQWMGNQHLETTLARLKALAISWGIGENLTTPIDLTIKVTKNGNKDQDGVVDKSEARKDKSLGVLCQKFMMLFLTSSPPHILQLDTVLHLLLGKEGENFDKLRTRGRRIYDIANVLISLQLMKKVSQSKSFMYIGPSVEASDLKEALLSDKQVRLRHSLLPPLNDFISDSCIQSPIENSENTGITPSNIPVIVAKKGRPRKLTSEFVQSGGNKNSVCNDRREIGNIESSSYFKTTHQMNNETKYNSSSDDRYIFLSPVDQHLNKKNIHLPEKNLVYNGDDRIVFTSPTSQDSNRNSLKQNSQKIKIVHSSTILRFPRLASPRMALTFQNSKHLSPSNFTNKPPAVTLPQIQVTTRLPISLQKVNVDNNSMSPQKKLETLKKPIYVIQASRPLQTGTGLNSNGTFKVLSRQVREGKSFSTPAYVGKNIAASQMSIVNKNYKVLSINNNIGKTMSSMLPFPNVNLNTLAKSHYKTVIGSQTKIPTFNPSSAVGNGAFHFVINTNKASTQNKTPSSETEIKSPSFVKIFERSPDNSSTDSELESIFGDSFNFTRPKTLVGGTSMNGKYC